MLCSLLLLDVLRDELLVFLLILLRCLVAVLSFSLNQLLSADFLFSNKSLDLGSLPECLLSSLDLTVWDVSANIILLFVEREELSDVVGSLLEKLAWSLNVGYLGDVLVSFL